MNNAMNGKRALVCVTCAQSISEGSEDELVAFFESHVTHDATRLHLLVNTVPEMVGSVMALAVVSAVQRTEAEAARRREYPQ